MKQDDIIEHEGRRFKKTGKVESVRLGKWYWSELLRQPIKGWDGDHIYERELLRELPAEPAPPCKYVDGLCSDDDDWQCPVHGEFRRPPEPGEAVRELSEKIRTLHNFDYSEGSVRDLDIKRVITEALAPLLEKAWNIVLNANLIPDPRMKGTTDCYAVPPEDVTDIESELARWQERKEK